jgi:uroporphyrinogen-III synthase
MSDIAVLTRPANRNQALAQRLRDAGWQACAWPALQIEPVLAGAGAVPIPADYELVVFVSGNAARLYLQQLRQLGHAAAWPGSCVAATVGPASGLALRESGWFGSGTFILHPGPQALRHDSESLWELIAARAPLPRRVLVVRGTQGRDWLAERLREHGAQVDLHAVYRRSPAAWDEAVLQQLTVWARGSTRPTWLLTSGEGIDAVRANVGRAGLAGWWQDCRFVLTHPQLEQRLELPVGAGRAAVKVCVPADDAIFNAFVGG